MTRILCFIAGYGPERLSHTRIHTCVHFHAGDKILDKRTSNKYDYAPVPGEKRRHDLSLRPYPLKY